MAWATYRISRADTSESRDLEPAATISHRHLRVDLASLFLDMLIFSCICSVVTKWLQFCSVRPLLCPYPEAKSSQPRRLKRSAVRVTFVSRRLLEYRFQVFSSVILSESKHLVQRTTSVEEFYGNASRHRGIRSLGTFCSWSAANANSHATFPTATRLGHCGTVLAPLQYCTVFASNSEPMASTNRRKFVICQ